MKLLDQFSSPVVGASVTWELSGDSFRGTTDIDGIAVLGWPTGATHVRAEKEGFAIKLVEVPIRHTSPLVVVLARRGCIAGRVLASEPIALEDVTVTAHPKHKTPSIADFTLPGPGLRWARPDADGSFLLCGLEDHEQWLLLAGGSGSASATPVEAMVESDELAQIDIEPYSFVALECVTGDGSTACLEGRLDDLAQGLSCAITRMSDLRHLRPLQAFLAGVPLDWCESRDGRRILIAPTAHARQDRVGIRCKAILPGYESSHAVFGWRPLHQGFQVETFILHPTSSAWGGLRCVLESAGAPDLSTLSPIRPLISLALRPTASGKPLRYDLTRLESDPPEALVRCLPPGTYEWWIESSMGHRLQMHPREQERFVTITAGGTTQLKASISGAAVEFILEVSGSANHEGPALFRISGPLEGSKPSSPSFVAFHRSPYRIPYLAQGRYSVALERPLSEEASGGASRDTSVVLAEGTKVTVSFKVLPP